MKHAIRLFALSSCALVIVAASAPGFAQGKSSAKPSGSGKTSGQEKKSLKAGFSLGYSVSSDLAQQREPRLYTNRLSTGINVSFLNPETGKENFSLAASVMGQYKSIGTEVESRSEVVELADLDLTASKDFELGKWAGMEHSMGLGLGTSAPTSEDSRYEGVKAVPSASLSLSSSFGLASLSQSLSYSYIVNTYDYSPVSHEINSDSSTSYSLTVGAKFLKYFRASVGGNAAVTHYLDGSNTLRFGNTQALSANYGAWSASLKHSNGSGINDKTVDLWFVDEYRRLVSFSLSRRF